MVMAMAILTSPLHMRITPTAFIYNKQGQLLQKTIGELDFNALKQLLNKELSV
jgi:hypothetical protein